MLKPEGYLENGNPGGVAVAEAPAAAGTGGGEPAARRAWLDGGSLGYDERPGAVTASARARAAQELVREVEETARRYMKLAEGMDSVLRAEETRRRSAWGYRPEDQAEAERSA
jgi:hypothetical protein